MTSSELGRLDPYIIKHQYNKNWQDDSKVIDLTNWKAPLSPKENFFKSLADEGLSNAELEKRWASVDQKAFEEAYQEKLARSFGASTKANVVRQESESDSETKKKRKRKKRAHSR